MKIAIATDNNYVSEHFGRCNQYTIFEVTGTTITSRAVVDTPPHEPGLLPQFLSEKGVTHVIAGGMGPKAQNLFLELNIEPTIGVSGKIDDVIAEFLAGRLVSGESTCSHGTDHHHDCNHS